MNRIDIAIAALLAAFLGGPTAPAAEEPELPSVPFIGPPRRHERLVIVTLDGVRWQEMFGGVDEERVSGLAAKTAAELAPNLHALATQSGAAIGAPGRGAISASGPNFVSLPGYREMLTGRPSVCQNNDCVEPPPETVLDAAHEAGFSVAAFGSWERLERAVSSHPGAFPIDVGRHGDPSIDPSPGDGDFRPDALTARAALTYLERERPDVLFLGLGEPDEYAHNGDYPGYVRSIEAADAIIGRLWSTLTSMDDRGAHLIVTADHGRDRRFKHHGGYDSESARVWLFAAGPRFRARGWAKATVNHHLSDIAPTVRSLLDLPTRRGGALLSELFESSVDN